MRRTLARPARLALGHPAVTRVAVAVAAARRRGLVLVFHRVTVDPQASTVVVPTVSRDVLREQITSLLGVGNVVPLDSILGDGSIGRRPRFALTFDDDSITHHAVVLPLLSELGVTATFFLSGRALRGLGPLWFEILDALIHDRGLQETASSLGLPRSDAQGIASACEQDPRLRRMVEERSPPVGQALGATEIADLRKAGMTIGFHTLHHRTLVGMPEEEVEAAVRDGREELEAVVGEPLRMFAYPHGKADARVARCVQLAGYDAAWTGRPNPVAPSTDRYLLGRWEPGASIGRDFGAKVGARTNGWGGP
jgi:peptidoglycan/xylan/chitin deacetylase (PgdA/CDA1 family)